MNRSVLMGVAVGFLASGIVLAVEPAKPDQNQQINMAMRQTELRQKQLDVEQRESKLRFEDKMRQLELEKHRVEIAAQEKAFQNQPPPPPSPTQTQRPLYPLRHHGPMGGLLVFAAFVHILLTIWVYQDIRKRNTGSGIWILMALFTGPIGTLLYVLVRIGDARKE